MSAMNQFPRCSACPSAPPVRMTGFTLVELMVVISLIAILVAVGIPSFRSITISYRISGEINGLLGDMQFARAEAIKEGQAVTICASTTSTAASPTCGGTDWDKGWIAFPDPNLNQTPVDPSTVLRVQAPFSGTDTLSDGTTGYVTFNREGLVNGLNGGAGALLALHEQSQSVTYTRCLQVSSVGALQVVQPAASNVPNSLADCT